MKSQDEIFVRHAQPLVIDALADTRVVFVAGARQVGKSTLAKAIIDGGHPAQELSLDNHAIREAALADPDGFVGDLDGPVFIDEVQRAPDLLLAIKASVDRDRSPGRFLLTGSTNVRALRKVKDALTGRMETITLWPLSQSEIHRTNSNLVDALFAGEPPRITDAPVGRRAFAATVAAGGFPEARIRDGRRRARWFASYVDTTLDRDLREISDARKLEEIPRLLRLLATQSANVLSLRALATKLDLTHDTVGEYIGLLQTIFLVRLLPAWRPGIAARETHAPKAHLLDAGLLAYLLGANEKRLATDDQVRGKVLENFAVTEMLKHVEWARTDTTAYHYRQREEEIDLVLECRSGDLVGIEIKAAASVSRREMRALQNLRERVGERFKAGIVLCACERTLPFGDRLWAVPLSGLWK